MPTDTPSPLAAAAEALLEAIDDDCGDEVELNRLRYEELTGDRMHPKMRPTEMEAYWVRFHSWVRARVVALRAALAADAAWRARAEAAIEVAEAVWAVDVAWMAYEPSDDPNAGPNASQKRHTAAVARLNAARRRYEETCRAG